MLPHCSHLCSFLCENTYSELCQDTLLLQHLADNLQCNNSNGDRENE